MSNEPMKNPTISDMVGYFLRILKSLGKRSENQKLDISVGNSF